MTTKVTWYGHSAVQVSTEMVSILIDPFFSGNSMAPVTAADVGADVIVVTHGHSDHLGDTVLLARRTGALVVSNFEIVTYLQKQGLEKLHPLHIGGGKSFSWGRVKLTMAMHGSSLPDGGYGGVAAGVLLNLGGTTIYHAGDTGLFYDMKLIGDARIDLAMIPIGDNFTMGPDDAVKAVSLLRPKMVAPMHYNTFDVIEQDPNEWAAAVERETSAKPKVLEPGQTIILE
ncbi:MAG: metal-dependent hydrolase [Deltaproteobacteria bacterium]|nr:metal-dependent hydrolase [Deltaproteobacteria bacterium]